MFFSDYRQKAGRHGKDDEERTEERTVEERPREFSREYWNVIYSRPKVMLRAAEGSATRGRDQHELRPRVDDFFLWTGRK